MSEPNRVEFYRHSLQPEDVEEAVGVLKTLFLTTGPVTRQVEEKLATFTGRRHVVGVSSCTSALFLSLKALGIGEGDEVVTTPMTFIATSNAILLAGATPVFCDVDPETGLLDVDRVEQIISERTKAVIPVHLYGQMVDMRLLAQVCRPQGVRIIEDAAHALESKRDGVGVGELGDVACHSFYATKNLTCGEGGAVTTDDPEVDALLRKTRLHGMSKGAADRYANMYQHWDMEVMGYKANLTDIQAALLVHQIDRLEAQRQRRQEIADRYTEAFREIPGLDLPAVSDDARSAWHLYTIWVPAEHRDETLGNLQDLGVGVAVNYRAVHLLKYYREEFGFERGSFPHAEAIGDRTISLPMYPGLTDDEVDHVIGAVRRVAVGWKHPVSV